MGKHTASSKSDRGTQPAKGGDQLTGGHCPLCNKPALKQWRPFCSRRCGDLDLGKWLNGQYVIASNTADDDEDGTPSAAEIAALKRE